MAGVASPATNVTVECRDRPRYRAPLAAGASVIDLMLPYGLRGGWVEIGPAPLVPIGSAVPTLVQAGEFDPITRPVQSQNLARLIDPSARWIVFPRIGHNVRAFSPCGTKIAAHFIDHPEQPPDAS
jgi:pimeloyl-ACP methyl ester carboxylesterase